MKKLFLPVFIFAVSSVSAQKMSCCTGPSNDMRPMANDPEFIAAHEAPLPFNYIDQAGKMISYSTPDGKTAAAYEVVSAKPTTNFLIITHEWWGLNDYIKQRADELQKTFGNINVIAVDMYDGKVASNPDSAGKYMKAATNDRIINILKGAISFAGSDARIYSLGWCFGGGYALQTAIVAGKQAAGCVMYYGMPETDMKKLETLNCDVLGLFATMDKWINPDVVKTFQTNMDKAGKKLTVKSYNADHGFANPSNPKYDKVSSADANQSAIEFIKSKLQKN
jgi:carboxymethylenebutenolidase